MAFGQPSGPPASAKQVNELLALLHAAGHSDFRDARGPLGLTQRQAGGKFTRDEADALIAQLRAAEGHAGDAALDVGSPGERRRDSRADRSRAPAERLLGTIPSEMLAAELQRRGWIVVEP